MTGLARGEAVSGGVITQGVEGLIASLAAAILDAHEQLASIATDVPALASSYVRLQQIDGLLRDLKSDLRRAAHDALVAADVRKVEVPGVGVVKVDIGAERSDWDHDGLARAVLSHPAVRAEILAAVDRAVDDGRVHHPHDAAAAAVDAVWPVLSRYVAPGVWKVGTRRKGSDWRIPEEEAPAEVWDGGLRSLGIRPDEFSRSKRRRSITINR